MARRSEYKLSEAQQACIAHREGPALVLAGPGSGKTTVITGRALRIAEELSSPERLLCVTFTRAAADEMRKRYIASCGEEAAKAGVPVFSTVHAFCNRIVGMYEKRTGTGYTRMEGEDSPKNEILSSIYRRLNGTFPDEMMLQRLTGYLQREREGRSSGSAQIRRFDEISKEYERIKAQEHLMDFEDMVRFACRLMRTDKRIAGEVKRMFDYIQVDEAQDLSRGQYDFIRLIAGNRNIFIVADDDQSIYGFRGADPGCLFDFVREYPDCRRYELTANYRSVPMIVSSAASLVEHNQKRFAKDLYSVNPPLINCVNVHIFKNGGEQARFCAEEVRRLVKAGSTCAVLYRNGMSGLPVKLWLRRFGLEYGVLGNSPGPWDTAAVKGAMFRIADAERNAGLILPRPRDTWRKLLRKGFGDKAVEQCEEEGRDRKYALISLEFVSALTSGAVSFADCERLLDDIERTDLGPEQTGASGQETGRKQVTLSTVHSSKGLEFDYVFLIDLLEGELPGSEAAGDTVEEERRLLYVGMTRARRGLALCYPIERGGFLEEPSRFIKEICINTGRN